MRNSMIFGAALLLMTSACDRKAEGQTVAVVNGEEITASELNAELSEANLPQGIDEAQAKSQVLEAMIDRRLLVQQAREQDLDTSPEFLNRHRKMTEDLLIGLLAARQVGSAQLPRPEEVARFEADNPNMFANREYWNLDQLIYATPENPQVAQQVNQSKTFDELINRLNANGIQFTRTKNRLDTSAVPPDVHRRIVALPAGEPFIVPAGARTVASVILSREPAPRSGEEAKPIAVAAIRRSQGASGMENRLKELRQSAKIDYKEGFAPKAPAASAARN